MVLLAKVVVEKDKKILLTKKGVGLTLRYIDGEFLIVIKKIEYDIISKIYYICFIKYYFHVCWKIPTLTVHINMVITIF